MRKLQIAHLTEYHFGSQVTLLPHRMLLRPRESHGLRIASSVLEISPTPAIRWQRDVLDNSVAVATFAAPASSLRVASQVVIEHYDEAPLDFVVEDYAAMHPFTYLPDEGADLAPMLSMAWPQDRAALDDWLRGLSLGSGRLETFVLLDRIARVCVAEVLGNQDGERSADEFGPRVAEQVLGLDVDQLDPAVFADDDYRVWRRVEQLAVTRFGTSGELLHRPLLFASLSLQMDHVGRVLDVMKDVGDLITPVLE